MYTYIHAHICIHTYTYTHTYTPIDAYAHTHTHTYINTYPHIHVYTYTCIHTRTFKYTYTYIHIHIHIDTPMRIDACAYMRAHACTCCTASVTNPFSKPISARTNPGAGVNTQRPLASRPPPVRHVKDSLRPKTDA